MTELCLSVGYKISQPGPEGSSRSGSSCRCLGPFRVIRATEVLFVCSHLISFMKQRALLHFCRSKASRRGAMRVVSTLVPCAVFQILPKAPTRSVFEALPGSFGKEPPPGLNRPRLCGQYKKPRCRILSFKRSGAATAAPLPFLLGCARGYRSKCTYQSVRSLLGASLACGGRCTPFSK